MDEGAIGVLSARFMRGLEAAPDQPAVRIGSDTISYAEVHRTALRWAAVLTEHAGGRPAPVGVLAAGSLPAYVGILAALYAGATVVPLHPDFPPARTRAMLDAAGVTVVVTDEPAVAGLPASLPAGRDVAVLVAGQDPQPRSPLRMLPGRSGRPLPAPRPVRPGDAAYMLFTSGSTGRPKGVPITHASLAHYFRLLDQRYDFDSADVFSQTFDLNFDCAMFDLFCAWGAGAQLLRVPGQAYRDLPGFLAAHQVSVWFSTPSSIGLVRRLGGLGAGTLPTLRRSFFAGEALRCRDAAHWQDAAVNSTVENLYGPTELTITVTRHRYGAGSHQLAVNGVVPIGPLHDGHEQLLVDEAGQPVADEGELWVSGPQLTPGYLDPADGDGRFVVRDGRTWYRTGDRVRRTAGGELLYLGRLDAQVQVHGWRVELAEIEHAVRGCVGVDDAAVLDVAVEDTTELVVFYTGRPAAVVELTRQLRQSLPQRLVPRRYEHRDELPLNANRKVDRPALRARAREMVTGIPTLAPA
ncbi:AMP-binding protein [Solwaraspora sp. WMMD937]|nr:AMP-binding protein [Solwaraspora sp. WMMD937]WFE24205.1 AMP-binding protein [Solwaraspora sp. WMMD937]